MSDNRAGVPSRIPDLDADSISSHDRRDQIERGRRLSAKEMRDLFADFPAIKVNQRAMELRVCCPWDRDVARAIGAISGAHFNARTKVWHLRLHAWQVLLELAPRIQQLVEDAWDDGFVEGSHRDGDDLRIVIPEARQGSYTINSIARFKGEPFIISHIGRPYLMAGKPVCNVYLVLAEPEAEVRAEPEDAAVNAVVIDDAPRRPPVAPGAEGALHRSATRAGSKGEPPTIDVNSDDISF